MRTSSTLQIQLGAQRLLLGLEAGFLGSTTCRFYTRLPRFAPHLTGGPPSFDLRYLIRNKAQYKAVRTIQAENAGLQR